jgi:hypothetical protein
MSETHRLVNIVLSLVDARAATRQNPVLNQLVGMAILEASECLVRAGFEPDGLVELGVAEEIVYLIGAERHSATAPGTTAPPRGIPRLRLVGS